MAGPNALGSARSSCDGSGPGEGTEPIGRREPGSVITDLAKDSCREDGTQPGRSAQLIGGVVLIELGGQAPSRMAMAAVIVLITSTSPITAWLRAASTAGGWRNAGSWRCFRIVWANPGRSPRPLRLSRVTTRLWVSFKPCAGDGAVPRISSAALCVSTGNACRALG